MTTYSRCHNYKCHNCCVHNKMFIILLFIFLFIYVRAICVLKTFSIAPSIKILSPFFLLSIIMYLSPSAVKDNYIVFYCNCLLIAVTKRLPKVYFISQGVLFLPIIYVISIFTNEQQINIIPTTFLPIFCTKKQGSKSSFTFYQVV